MNDCYINKVCRNSVVSTAVTFADGTLTINIPDNPNGGPYLRGCKYCITIAQDIPAETTITAPVVITIGTGTETYPLLTCGCAQVTACGVRSGYRYAVRVATSATGGSFRMLGRPWCSPDYSLAGIDGTAPATGGAAG